MSEQQIFGLLALVLLGLIIALLEKISRHLLEIKRLLAHQMLIER
jgi:hypothetical protein